MGRRCTVADEGAVVRGEGGGEGQGRRERTVVVLVAVCDVNQAMMCLLPFFLGKSASRQVDISTPKKRRQAKRDEEKNCISISLFSF